MAKSSSKVFPKVRFYDQDLVELYDRSWTWIKKYWHSGTEENDFALKYFNYPENDFIHQLEACLSTFFLVYSNRNYPVTPLLDNFYTKAEPSGAIRGIYREKDGKPLLNRKNPEGVLPPLFAWAEFNIYHKVGLKKRVREIMPVLENYYTWLEKNFKKENGLYSVPPEATGLENAPRGDMVYPIDFNAQQAINALYMSALGDIINDKEKSYKYKRYYYSIKTRINQYMWSETDNFYYDLDKKGRQIKNKTLGTFWCLLAEIPNKEKADRLIEQLNDPNEFGSENPFPTLPVRNKYYSKQGLGYRGSVFPHLNYIIIKGLEKYGKFDIAREFAIRHLYMILDGLQPDDGNEGSIWEAYSPVTNTPAKWPKRPNFPRKLFLPYAALSSIALMIENVIGFYISLPRKTIYWIIPTMEIMGIEDLYLKRNMIKIMSNQSGRGWEIRLESEKLYYFTINILGIKKKTLPIPSGKCSILIDRL